MVTEQRGDYLKIAEELTKINKKIVEIGTEQVRFGAIQKIMKQSVDKIGDSIYGNGQQGLISKVDVNARDMKNMRDSVKNTLILVSVVVGSGGLMWTVLKYFV